MYFLSLIVYLCFAFIPTLWLCIVVWFKDKKVASVILIPYKGKELVIKRNFFMNFYINHNCFRLEEIIHGSISDANQVLARTELDPTTLSMCVSTFKKWVAYTHFCNWNLQLMYHFSHSLDLAQPLLIVSLQMKLFEFPVNMCLNVCHMKVIWRIIVFHNEKKLF